MTFIQPKKKLFTNGSLFNLKSLIFVVVVALTVLALVSQLTQMEFDEKNHHPLILEETSSSSSSSSQALAVTPQEKKLLVMNAIGRADNLPFLIFSKERHFADWDCLAFMYVNEQVIPDNHVDLERLREVGCNVVRTPNVMWGVFLQYLPPVLVQPYAYVAILLDDVFLPDRGPTPVNIPRLLSHMKQHNLTSISPAVIGEFHKLLSPVGRDPTCLVELRMINTYMQIFTADAWACYYSMLHHAGGRGFCYDGCLLHKCGGRLAADYTQVSYHLEQALLDIPAAAKLGTNLTFVKAPRQEQMGMYAVNKNQDDLWYICKRLGCPEMEVLRRHVKHIECASSRNTTTSPTVVAVP